jgi:hypothetical protein
MNHSEIKSMIFEELSSILEEDFDSFIAELEKNEMGFRDYESGFDYDAPWEISRRPEHKKPEFKSKAVALKKMWNKHVDRNFIQSLRKVHWLRDSSEGFRDFDSKKKNDHPMSRVMYNLSLFFETTPREAEVSTTGFLPNTKLQSSWGKFGILIDGRVTFAGNHMDVVWSGNAPDIKYRYFKPQMRDKVAKRPGRFTNLDFIKSNKTYILDRESYDEKFSGVNELIVAHWKPISIVFPREAWLMLAPLWKKKVLDLAAKNNCNVIDENSVVLNNKITTEERKNVNAIALQEMIVQELRKLVQERKLGKPSSETNLGDWFKRKGAPGKKGGWVDCNTCRDGKCKPCGRQEGEKRSKYPRCRPTPSQCKGYKRRGSNLQKD